MKNLDRNHTLLIKEEEASFSQHYRNSYLYSVNYIKYAHSRLNKAVKNWHSVCSIGS